jgi:hypothetical protein
MSSAAVKLLPSFHSDQCLPLALHPYRVVARHSGAVAHFSNYALADETGRERKKFDLTFSAYQRSMVEFSVVTPDGQSFPI